MSENEFWIKVFIASIKVNMTPEYAALQADRALEQANSRGIFD